MITYNDFLSTLNLPSEEEFNNIIENLPPFDSLDGENFEYDPQWDNLAEQLFNYGVLNSFKGCWADELNYENKITFIQDINNLEELNKINNLLTSAGWTLRNYEEDKKFFEEEEAKDRMENEKKQLLSKIKNASIEQLREFAKNVD